MSGRGASEAMTQAMVNMMAAAIDGVNNLVHRTDSCAADTPTSFRQWCMDVLKPALAS